VLCNLNYIQVKIVTFSFSLWLTCKKKFV